jgi:hypothetical protein
MLKCRVEERLGIGLNVQHFMALTGWSQSQIAQLMEPCAEHASLKQLKHSLSAVVFRKQTRWKYSSVFALAFGLPEQALLVEDLRHYGSLPSSQRHYSFNLQDVIRRSEALHAKRWRDASAKTRLSARFYRDLHKAAGTFATGREDGEPQ